MTLAPVVVNVSGLPRRVLGTLEVVSNTFGA